MAYLNNVQNGFGNQLRRVINRLLNIKERAQQMKQSLIHEGMDEEEVDRRLRSDIYQPATNFKMAISRRRPRLSPNSPEFIRDAFTSQRTKDLETSSGPSSFAIAETKRFDCSSRFYSPIRINTGSDKTLYIWTARLHHSAISNPIIYWPDCAKNHISSHSKPFRYAHPGCQGISR